MSFVLLLLLGFFRPVDCDGNNAHVVFEDHRNGGEPIHLYWVSSAQKWPPAPPATLEDRVFVKCVVAHRRLAPENAPVSTDTPLEAIERLRADLDIDGAFTITVRKDWAPLGAERFLTLVKMQFYDGIPLFRAVDNFLVQFGVSLNADLEKEWSHKKLMDEPLMPEMLPLPRGTLSYAGHGNNSRSTQMWLSFAPGVAGKMPWETPVGFVAGVDGLDQLDRINREYGDMGGFGGRAPDQFVFKRPFSGMEYLRTSYPRLSYFESCKVVDDAPSTSAPAGAAEEQLEEVAEIGAGSSVGQNTRLGAVFVAKLDGNVIGRFTVTEDEQRFLLTATQEL